MQRTRLGSSEADRNMASPTESAIGKRRLREHLGADRLNLIADVGRYGAVHVTGIKEEM